MMIFSSFNAKSTGGFAPFMAQFADMCCSSKPLPVAPLSVNVPGTPGVDRQNSQRPLDAPASEILPYLIMSNERDARNPAFIQEHKITHVLNLTTLPSHPDVERIATCFQISLTDTTDQDISFCLDDAIRFIGARDFSLFGRMYF